MKDMLDIIYRGLRANDTVSFECEDRIKYYIYPEGADTSKPFLTIRPLNPPQAVNYGSDKSLGYLFYHQIDVQAGDRKTCKKIQHAVKEVMDGLGFVQQSAGLDEYFEDTKRFVDARRYLKTTKLYDTDY